MEALVSALGRELPEWDITPAEGGWSLWITLPSGSAAALAQVALRHGVAIAPCVGRRVWNDVGAAVANDDGQDVVAVERPYC